MIRIEKQNQQKKEEIGKKSKKEVKERKKPVARLSILLETLLDGVLDSVHLLVFQLLRREVKFETVVIESGDHMDVEMKDALTGGMVGVSDDVDTCGTKLTDLGLTDELSDFKGPVQDILRACQHGREVFLGDDKGMTTAHGIDIKEGDDVIILIDLIGRNRSVGDLTENTGCVLHVFLTPYLKIEKDFSFSIISSNFSLGREFGKIDLSLGRIRILTLEDILVVGFHVG